MWGVNLVIGFIIALQLWSWYFSTQMKLGSLKKLNLRDVWKSEAGQFTPWLAKDDNLTLLGETIGMELELEDVEKNVGPYRADIFCRETASESWVLVENQIEKTDHTHLGQILTYAAGLNAVTIVWVAQRFTDEHRATLDWLNEITGDDINFFGLEIEVWKIGESLPAPKFNIVAKPNQWTKGGASRRVAKGELTETKKLQLDYWLGFKQSLQDQDSFLRPQKAAPCHWLNFPIGASHAHIYAFVDTVKGRIGARLQFKGPNHVELCNLLKAEIKLAGTILEGAKWEPFPEKKSSYLSIRLDGNDPMKRQLWPEQFVKLQEVIETLDKTFRLPIKKHVQMLKGQ